jgi:hypothetical protein
MKKLFLASVLGSMSILAQAGDAISYDYIQLGYTMLDREARPGDPKEMTGYHLAGSKMLQDNFFIAGEYTANSEVGVDITHAKAGVGYRYELRSNLDLFAQVSYLQVEIGSRLAGTFEDKGTSYDIGIRTMLNDSFELLGAVEYQKDTDEDRTFVVLSGLYQFDDTFSAFADYKTESDSDTFTLGVRYHY